MPQMKTAYPRALPGISGLRGASILDFAGGSCPDADRFNCRSLSQCPQVEFRHHRNSLQRRRDKSMNLPALPGINVDADTQQKLRGIANETVQTIAPRSWCPADLP